VSINICAAISETQARSHIKISVFAVLKISNINREFQLKWGLQYCNCNQTKVCLGSILAKNALKREF
jgi:hypothetical protein